MVGSTLISVTSLVAEIMSMGRLGELLYTCTVVARTMNMYIHIVLQHYIRISWLRTNMYNHQGCPQSDSKLMV